MTQERTRGAAEQRAVRARCSSPWLAKPSMLCTIRYQVGLRDCPKSAPSDIRHRLAWVCLHYLRSALSGDVLSCSMF